MEKNLCKTTPQPKNSKNHNSIHQKYRLPPNNAKKAKYDKETKYAIGELDGQEIYMTEFLMAKELGFIEKFQGHRELKEYIKLVPYIFTYYQECYLDTKTKRKAYIIDDNDGRKIAHVIDENNFLVTVYLLRKSELKRFLKRAELILSNPSGEAPISPILSPARRATFWRHLGLIEQLYQDLAKKSITQEPFIDLVNAIIDAKETIAKYKKHFETLNAVDKIEIKEEIEKLKNLLKENVEKIDSLVYELYDVNSDEINTIEGKKQI